MIPVIIMDRHTGNYSIYAIIICFVILPSAISEVVEVNNDQRATNHSSQQYWDKRIYKITELKSYIKDEKSPYDVSPDSFLL